MINKLYLALGLIVILTGTVFAFKHMSVKSINEQVAYPGMIVDSSCFNYWSASVKKEVDRYDDCREKKSNILTELIDPAQEKFCPMENFVSKVMPKSLVDRCEKHLLRPKFPLGSEVHFTDNTYYVQKLTNCVGIVIDTTYKQFNDDASKYYITYYLEVFCDGKELGDRNCAIGNLDSCHAVSEHNLIGVNN